jgi:hypothetical protein
MATSGQHGRGAAVARFVLRYTGRLVLGLGVGWSVAGIAALLLYGVEEFVNARFETDRLFPVSEMLFVGGLVASSVGAPAGAVLGAWLAPRPSAEFKRRVLWRSVWSALSASLLGAVSGALCIYVTRDSKTPGALGAVGASGVLAGVVGAAFTVLFTRRSARGGRSRILARAAGALGLAIVPCAPLVAWLLAGTFAELRHGHAEPIHEGKTTWQWIEELEQGPTTSRIAAAGALRYASARMRQGAPALDEAEVSAAVSALTRALDDTNARLRRDATESLAHFDRDARPAAPRLRQALQEQDAGVRVRAARALYVIGEPTPEALKVLMEILKNPDLPGGIRRLAAQGLAWVGPDAGRAMPILRQAMKDEDDLVSKAATQALKALQAAAPQWDPFTCEDGGFSVLMPGSPQALAPPPGDPPIEGRGYGADAGGLEYKVSFERLAAEWQAEDKIETIFDLIRDAAVRNTKGRLLSERRITLESVRGREFLIELPDSALIRRRAFVAHKRLYRLVVGGLKQGVLSEDADRFFESFRLLGP